MTFLVLLFVLIPLIVALVAVNRLIDRRTPPVHDSEEQAWRRYQAARAIYAHTAAARAAMYAEAQRHRDPTISGR